jgi:predicted DNA-binding transcriptional regulator AlpA
MATTRHQIETVDTAGIAAMVGVKQRHATDVLTKAPDFPKPVINLSQRVKRWDQAEVLKWIQRRTARNS